MTAREDTLVRSKLPVITLVFWVMKICATTLGETAGDLFSMTLGIGYAASSVMLVGGFLVALWGQVRTDRYRPALYWTVILMTSTAGTTMSDFMDRTLGWGYAFGSAVLLVSLGGMITVWWFVERSLSVTEVRSRRAELFYWSTILLSNTLGTALGDYLADDSGLGFAGGALLIGACLALVAAAYYGTKLSRIALFWIAFVLTRPFGATFGDVLTKSTEKGGLDLGTAGSSMVLLGILAGLLVYLYATRDGVNVGATPLAGPADGEE